MTIEERAKSILAQYTKQPTAIDLYSRDEVLRMLVEAFRKAMEETQPKSQLTSRRYGSIRHCIDYLLPPGGGLLHYVGNNGFSRGVG